MNLFKKQLSFSFFLVITVAVALVAAGVVGYFFYIVGQDLIREKYSEAPPPISISAGVVPHHLVARDIIEDFFAYIAFQGQPVDRPPVRPETIILLSPDHFQAASVSGGGLITVDTGSHPVTGCDPVRFHGLEVDSSLIQALSENYRSSEDRQLVFSDSAVSLEHGITNLFPFIKKYLPESKIVPFIIPANVSLEEINQLASSLDSLSSDQTIVVASVDFSHYLPASAADFHDVKSIRTLLTRSDLAERSDLTEFEDLEVDSWQCLYLVRKFSQVRKKEIPHIIGQGNSADFLKARIDQPEETTSYFSVVFEDVRVRPVKESVRVGPVQEFEAQTILFVGDMMFDRNVEGLIKKHGSFYPFQKISQFLKGVDLVFGNLEGPIVKKPLGPIPHTMVFSFPPEVAQTLAEAYFNILTLANNHGLDMGRSGLEETRENLGEKNIIPIGDPGQCKGDFFYSHQLKNGGSSASTIKFFALNKVYNPVCKDEDILEAIKSVRNRGQSPSGDSPLIIVSVHWGEEYQLTNSFSQRELAHQLIDAGADLIIGHHPHVVQNIEMYKGKLIFYSLGNFVFDQYFSKETQEGLAVGLEIWGRGQSPKLIYRLFPIRSDLSQPALMSVGESREFLENLADRSDKNLFHQIKNGIMIIEGEN